ncbi:MAG: GatB/YqeY domain-containing protein [Dehalococcoidia bacterium]|nr:MAG: GatB/YqeY domain-containing protein [bacterium]MCK6564318.1 GatB/YqeY domain-containing protein [Dehalococcoidia bacterium]MCL4231461.1 GatB/YqeY domain-containing protein [Dehalococcoidia bacterium]NUQ54588.1 GatB/YqeY domain-containing protein [Dehalococcoidia bacterium]RIL03721.1 MAG: aspartyl-tRNA amidotransferase [bacterium]
MTALKDQVQADLHDAIRARDEIRKVALRMLTAAIRNTEIELRHELDDAGVLAVVQKQVKQRRDSIVEFRKGGREDLVAKEEGELAWLEAYLPRQATREEIEAAARRAVAETGASGPRDIGKVMPGLMQQFAGRTDGKMVSDIVRELLAGQ